MKFIHSKKHTIKMKLFRQIFCLFVCFGGTIEKYRKYTISTYKNYLFVPEILKG